MINPVAIAVLVSGGGSNLQAIIDSCETGILKGIARVAIVVSSRSDAYAIERAKKHKILTAAVERKSFSDEESFDKALLDKVRSLHIDLVCLAGYMRKLPSSFVKAYSGRMLNIHPALLPKFGGKGMYGHHVHEAVIAAGEKESGATVHWVDEEYDHGNTIAQKKVPVSPEDTPETLAGKVLKIEHQIYSEAIETVAKEINRCC